LEVEMRKPAWIAIAAIVAVCGVVEPLVSPWGPVAELACAETSKPRGHPHPEIALPDDPPELDEIIETYAEAVGGRAAFERIASRIARARIVTDLPTWDPPVFEIDTVTVYSQAPDQYLILQQTVRGTVLEGSDGTTAWKRDVEGKAFAIHASDDGRDAWLVDPQFPIRLYDYFPDMAYLGVSVLWGQELHVVDTDGNDNHYLYFDVASGLLARIGFNRKVGDYRDVDGVKIPFEVEYSRKGGSSTFVFDAVIPNVHVDERLFEQPTDE
jgi:hypothetical protein